MLRLVVVRRLAWRLADRGIMRERIEESLKRQMVVRTPDDNPNGLGLAEEVALEAQTLPDVSSARR